jgi:hypothetical protein
MLNIDAAQELEPGYTTIKASNYSKLAVTMALNIFIISITILRILATQCNIYIIQSHLCYSE